VTAGQFGHGKDQVVYEFGYHVFNASLDYNPTERLNLNGSFTYTSNIGSFDPIKWSGIDPQAFATLVASGKWSYDFSGVDGLSDIDTNTLEARLVASYMVSEMLSLYGDVLYSDWTDNEYIIENGTGDFLAASFGVGVRF